MENMEVVPETSNGKIKVQAQIQAYEAIARSQADEIIISSSKKKKAVKNENVHSYAASAVSDTCSSVSCIPILCPIATCNQKLASNGILAHILDHHKKLKKEMREACSDNVDIFSMIYSKFKCYRNTCIGLLKVSDLCDTKSDGTQAEQAEKVSETIILIMCCKTNWTTLASKDRDRAKHVANLALEVLMIWFWATRNIPPTLNATIRCYNEDNTFARTAVLQVQEPHAPQNPKEFLQKLNACLIISCGEINNLQRSDGSIEFAVKMHNPSQIDGQPKCFI